MPAKVTENPVEVWTDTLGRRLDTPRKTTAFTAWCDECADDVGVNWRGTSWPVGYVSAPNFEAILDADAHNDEHHPNHTDGSGA